MIYLSKDKRTSSHPGTRNVIWHCSVSRRGGGGGTWLPVTRISLLFFFLSFATLQRLSVYSASKRIVGSLAMHLNVCWILSSWNEMVWLSVMYKTQSMANFPFATWSLTGACAVSDPESAREAGRTNRLPRSERSQPRCENTDLCLKLVLTCCPS